MNKENKKEQLVFIHQKDRKTYPAMGIMIWLKGDKNPIAKSHGEQVYLLYDRIEIVNYAKEFRTTMVIPMNAIAFYTIETERQGEKDDNYSHYRP